MKLRQRLRRIGSGAWSTWPAEAYQQPRYQQRLLAVQDHLFHCLDVAPRGPLCVTSICAGDGRDVIGVLRSHERGNDVTAWLVELDRESVAAGIRATTTAGLHDSVNFLNTDATDYATYAGFAPADIVLACGVWGHVPADQRASLVNGLAALCNPGGASIWTRGVADGRNRLHEIESLFARPLWECIRTTATGDKQWAVSTHRYCGPRVELPQAGRIFNFQRRAGR